VQWTWVQSGAHAGDDAAQGAAAREAVHEGNRTGRGHRRAGKVDQAVSFLSAQIARQTTDNETSSSLYLVLGEMLFEAGRVDQANAAFEALLKLNGIKTDPITTEDQRELAAMIFEKMIALFKESGRIEDAKSVINRARIVFGEDDQFSGRALISLFRETNQRPDALREVRSLRSRFPQDTSLLRLEAQLLNEVGKVGEAVALIEAENARIGNKDDLENAMAYFSNQIFVTSLYVEAKRGKLALASAKKALLLAKGNEQELTAKFSLATAAHEAHDYSTSESTLREVLAKSPRNPVALNNLGYFLADRGVRLDEAFILISDALKIDPMNPNYLDSLGWVNFKRGNLADAEINLMEAIRVDKSSGTTHEHLGDVFSQNGKLAQALGAWKTAISLLWHPTDINRIKSKIATAEKKK